MVWTNKHNEVLVQEMYLFEPWNFKPGSKQRGQVWERISDSLSFLFSAERLLQTPSNHSCLTLLYPDYPVGLKTTALFCYVFQCFIGQSPKSLDIFRILSFYFHYCQDYLPLKQWIIRTSHECNIITSFDFTAKKQYCIWVTWCSIDMNVSYRTPMFLATDDFLIS